MGFAGGTTKAIRKYLYFSKQKHNIRQKQTIKFKSLFLPFDASVSLSHVGTIISLTSKRGVAEFADVWPFPRVDVEVILVQSLLEEPFVAVRASEGSLGVGSVFCSQQGMTKILHQFLKWQLSF